MLSEAKVPEGKPLFSQRWSTRSVASNAAQRRLEQRALQRITPTHGLARVERGHQQRHEEHLARVGEALPHLEVSQHLEVLDRQRVAVVVVRDALGRDLEALALRHRLDHRRAQAANRVGRLHDAVAQLLAVGRRDLAEAVLRCTTARGPEPARDAEQDPAHTPPMPADAPPVVDRELPRTFSLTVPLAISRMSRSRPSVLVRLSAKSTLCSFTADSRRSQSKTTICFFWPGASGRL